VSVLGVGLDIIDIAGFGERLNRDAGLADATFTAAERADAEFGAGDRAGRLAGRLAAKQAFVKAWSASRFGRPPALARVDLRALEIRPDGHGRPAIVLHGEVSEELASLSIQLELRGEIATHVSISHDGGLAAAVVVLSAT
jgi:holo-[acyl-carrier protein] synthase